MRAMCDHETVAQHDILQHFTIFARFIGFSFHVLPQGNIGLSIGIQGYFALWYFCFFL